MSTACPQLQADAGFQLHFRSLARVGRGVAFPCDARGHVDMDALSRSSLLNYLYARAVVGCEFSRPVVTCAALQQAPMPTSVIRRESTMAGAF
jgi:hypothetical protein